MNSCPPGTVWNLMPVALLVSEDLISSYEDENVTFYITTTCGNDYLKKPFPLNETLPTISTVASTLPLLA